MEVDYRDKVLKEKKLILIINNYSGHNSLINFCLNLFHNYSSLGQSWGYTQHLFFSSITFPLGHEQQGTLSIANWVVHVREHVPLVL